ncbi:MAG: hypothetical protein WC511_02435 [Candidatus Pacearchaeota archaeon]
MSQCILCGKVDDIRTPFTVCCECSKTKKVESVFGNFYKHIAESPGKNSHEECGECYFRKTCLLKHMEGPTSCVYFQENSGKELKSPEEEKTSYDWYSVIHNLEEFGGTIEEFEKVIESMREVGLESVANRLSKISRKMNTCIGNTRYSLSKCIKKE